jgi:hypothetical protein
MDGGEKTMIEEIYERLHFGVSLDDIERVMSTAFEVQRDWFDLATLHVTEPDDESIEDPADDELDEETLAELERSIREHIESCPHHELVREFEDADGHCWLIWTDARADEEFVDFIVASSRSQWSVCVLTPPQLIALPEPMYWTLNAEHENLVRCMDAAMAWTEEHEGSSLWSEWFRQKGGEDVDA